MKIELDETRERLNLVIPAYIKEYLKAAAYRESDPEHMVSVTEYLCGLIMQDMRYHGLKIGD